MSSRRTAPDDGTAAAEKQLKKIWDETFGNDGLTREAAEDAWNVRQNEHLPLTLDIVRLTAPAIEYGRSTGEKTLLLMAGYTAEQLILSIAVHASQCGHVVPFSSAEAWDHVFPIVVSGLPALGIDPRILRDPILVDPNDPAAVFRSVAKWIRENASCRPAVDSTGGKKPMDSGATYAASFYGVPAYYLNYQDYHTVARRPLPWTCRYHELDLPDSVFSLPWRRAAFEAFSAKRFATAADHVGRIDSADIARKYLEEDDLRDLRRVHTLALRSSQWMRLEYHTELLSEHLLHGVFREERQKPEPDLRRLVESLQSFDMREKLREYVVDEYWRLRTLADSGDTREALIGAVGLAELTVDALFFRPWFAEAKVTRVDNPRWQELPEGTAARNPLDTVKSWDGKSLPADLLPLAHMGAKLRLLRKGEATLNLRVNRGEDGEARLSPPRADGRTPYLEASASIRVPTPIEGWSTAAWRRYWGSFPDGQWVQLRHALVHLRAPLVGDEVVKKALETYLPRFVELLFRIDKGGTADIGGSGDDDWITWWRDDRWKREARLPWEREQDNLMRWLRLDV